MKRIAAAFLSLAVATTALADGAATYAKKCKACHGAKGSGTKLAPEAIAGMEAELVLKTIEKGKGKMQPVKIDDARDVADYVAAMK